MHDLPEVHRNYSCKTFWSTFLALLLFGPEFSRVEAPVHMSGVMCRISLVFV